MNVLIKRRDRCHHCVESNALHKNESDRRFIGASLAKRCEFFTHLPHGHAECCSAECCSRVRRMFEARFQTFDDSSAGAQSAVRIASLRAELKRRGLDGLVVPRADRQQNEYLPASEARFAWLTGFTGSAGAAIVLAERAALFVDGRYTVQAAAQIDAKLFATEHLVDSPPEQWLEQNLKSGAKLGYDPWLHTSESADRLRKACATAGAELVAVEGNPIDALWRDRPAPPAGPVSLRDIK